jgi:hypothetical protein
LSPRSTIPGQEFQTNQRQPIDAGAGSHAQSLICRATIALASFEATPRELTRSKTPVIGEIIITAVDHQERGAGLRLDRAAEDPRAARSMNAATIKQRRRNLTADMGALSCASNGRIENSRRATLSKPALFPRSAERTAAVAGPAARLLRSIRKTGVAVGGASPDGRDARAIRRRPSCAWPPGGTYCWPHDREDGS